MRPEYRNPHIDTFWRDLDEKESLLSKYFWFCGCIKHLILPFIVACLYQHPYNQLLGLSIFQAIWVMLCVGIIPYKRKYMRLNLYISETLKFLMYVSALNFQQQYVGDKTVVSIVHIMYVLVILLLASSLLFLLGHLAVEYKVYLYSMRRLGSVSQKVGRGVFLKGKLYIYEDNLAKREE